MQKNRNDGRDLLCCGCATFSLGTDCISQLSATGWMHPKFLAQEHVMLGQDYLKQPFVIENGYIPLPTKPGLVLNWMRTRLQIKCTMDRGKHLAYGILMVRLQIGKKVNFDA